MIDALPLLLGPEGYQISRSVRLRSSASAYLDRAMTSSFTSQRIFTFSFWCKRGTLSSATQTIFDRNQSTNVNQFTLGFSPDDTFGIAARTSGTSTVSLQLITSGVFRDPSAWYHFVISVDNTQATLANRGKIYVNGVLQSLGTQTATQNVNYHLLTGLTYNIGRTALGSTNYVDGYLTEFNFIDGQQLDPSSFGETNPITGVWQPKRYAGTYGNNGFYLNFSDNSAATAAAIGKDYSGNGNNWTPNNISVTAGATYDSMLDVPTQWADGDNGRGNYAVMNPLTYGGTIDNGNLEIVSLASYSSSRGGTSTIAADGGKFYWEATKLSGSSTDLSIGICTDANFIAGAGNRFYYDSTGDYSQNGSVVSTAPATYATNDIIGLAVDATTSAIEFFKNGVSQGSYTMSFAGPYFAQIIDGTAAAQARFAINFGQRPFAYTPPTGFKALNTLNLPTPTILKGNQYFDATTYTGTGASLNVVNSGGMQPDFVWTKPRSTAVGHTLFDSVRGVTKYLQSNTTGAEGTAATSLTAFNSDGFTVNSDTSTGANGVTYVGWQWKEGATQGFDIVTFTGTGGVQNISHSLGVAPKMMIFKSRNNVSGWSVYHASVGNTGALNLQTTAATSTTIDWWNNTSPTSTQFTIGANININTWTWVGYLFAEVAGFSKFGSYTGNGSADGPFVFCGFRPRFLMLKRYDSTGDWLMLDSQRSPSNVISETLFANTAAAEASTSVIDFLSNGFKLRGLNYNASGSQFIIAAFAENPLKFSLAR